ncbi:hypothetical protein Syun_020697 [Stephania yunnanensis]|uniref:beta-ketoacyl-[acyl-carrier-protein] synthase I n=1 Tax=Stephania yunnanensis TaxID=152371 RepID=A0AAP0IEP4_9MAGN
MPTLAGSRDGGRTGGARATRRERAKRAERGRESIRDRREVGKALVQSGVSMEDVNYINAHATSTQAGDIKEYQALIRCFGHNPELKVNSTKSMIGHLLGVAGVVEAVATIQASMVRQMKDSEMATQWTLIYQLTSRLRLLLQSAPSKRLLFEYSTTSQN